MSYQTLYAHWDDVSSFSIPSEIDLRDRTKYCWFVRWNTLHIETKDGDAYEIEATEDPQLKNPERYSLYDHDGGGEEDIDSNHHFEPGFEPSSESEESESDEEEEEESGSKTDSENSDSE